MGDDFQKSSRVENRARNRDKKNQTLVFTGLVTFAVIVILFAGYKLFFSKDSSLESTSTTSTNTTSTEKQVEEENSDNNMDSANSETNESNSSLDPEIQSETEEQSGNVVTSGGSSANVIQTITNSSWKPVGTSQTGQHNIVYDLNSTDWQEMLNAICYATGLEQSNMIVWFIGRDKITGTAPVGTVSSKDKTKKYKVYLQWIDGQGYKPDKVEELYEIQY